MLLKSMFAVGLAAMPSFAQNVDPCNPASQACIYPAEATDTSDPASWGRFAWDGFIALNWPQLEGGSPGEPDTAATICDLPGGRPTFLQWMQKEQLMLPGGASPGS